MTQLFNLEEYKSYLINYFKYAYDRDRYDERSHYIETHYPDNYLKDIVENTEGFVLTLLKDIKDKNQTYGNSVFLGMELPMDGIESYYISNGCVGGWHSDELFYADEKEKSLISMYLIKNFFGNKFQTELSVDPREDVTPEENSGVEYCIPIFYIVGPKDEFNRIYESYNKELIEGEEQNRIS